MFNQLEGDGVIDNLYHLLWTKDSIFENCNNDIKIIKLLFVINIPILKSKNYFVIS